jgi:hypothetical protein
MGPGCRKGLAALTRVLLLVLE